MVVSPPLTCREPERASPLLPFSLALQRPPPASSPLDRAAGGCRRAARTSGGRVLQAAHKHGLTRCPVRPRQLALLQSPAGVNSARRLAS